MSTQRVQRKYRCKQTELYAVFITYVLGVIEYSLRFASHNSNYAAAQMPSVQAFFDSVKALPNFQQRNEPSETLRVFLKTQSDLSMNKWRALRTFIEGAYEGDLMKPKLESAGWVYLTQANNYNWEDVNELIESGMEFLNANEAELITNGGMLPTFKMDYETEFNKFTVLFIQIPNSVLSQRVMTDEKVIANNNLYDWLIKTGKDANVIFYNEEETAIREKFVFSNVLAAVSSSGPATLKGKVTDTTNNPISGVNVILETLDVEITTDANGDFNSGNIPSGEYKLKFEKEGFVPFEIEIVINKGVTKTQDAVLTAV